MINEQELSDEKKIQAFKRCLSESVNCNGCPYKTGLYRCDMKRLHKDILGIVQNLKDEVKALKKKTTKSLKG